MIQVPCAVKDDCTDPLFDRPFGKNLPQAFRGLDVAGGVTLRFYLLIKGRNRKEDLILGIVDNLDVKIL